MSTPPPTVQFCYRCGKRVDPARSSCWYCGTRTQRELRPPRKCPFCGEQIAQEAIKCRHCGEFLDGRERPGAAPPPTQVVYIVDAAMLRAAQAAGQGGMPGNALGGGFAGAGGTAQQQRLLPGQPVPEAIARSLDPQTLHAIEHNRPDLLQHPAVRALPMPAAGPVLDVVPLEAQGRDVQRPLPLAGQGGDQSTALPARAGGSRAAARRGGLGQWLARWLVGNRHAGAAPGDEADIPVSAQEPYRRCESCGSEILSSDNYCYHCGMQYHVSKADVRRAQRVEYPSNGGRYLLIVLLTAAMGWHHYRPIAQLAGYPADWIAIGVILLLCLGAFFRRRTTPAQLTSILLALGALAVFFLV